MEFPSPSNNLIIIIIIIVIVIVIVFVIVVVVVGLVVTVVVVSIIDTVTPIIHFLAVNGRRRIDDRVNGGVQRKDEHSDPRRHFFGNLRSAQRRKSDDNNRYITPS